MNPTARTITRTTIAAALLAFAIAVTPPRSAATIDGLDLSPPAPVADTMLATTITGSSAFWRTGDDVTVPLSAQEVGTEDLLSLKQLASG
jgi:hypothetical protein